MKTRFIAGAKCPECSALDSIKVHYFPDAPRYECVQCGHEDVMDLSSHSPTAKVPAAVKEEPAQVLQFDPKPPK